MHGESAFYVYLYFCQKLIFDHSIPVVDYKQLKRFADGSKLIDRDIVHHFFQADGIVHVAAPVIAGKIISGRQLAVIFPVVFIQYKKDRQVDIGDSLHQIFSG